MSHPFFPIIVFFIFVFVYGLAKIIVKLGSTKFSDWEVISTSIVISFTIIFAWWYSGTSAQRWAVEQCKSSKLEIYETSLAEGFYQHTFGLNTDLLRAIMDGSFKYVETRVKRQHSNLSYSKYYISELSDINCQSLHSNQATKYASKKLQYVRRNFPILKPGLCIAIEYRDTLESKYQYSSYTTNARGEGNRRVSTKLVTEIDSKKILAEWKGYSGSSMMGSSKRCSYPEEDLPFKKVLFSNAVTPAL